MKINWTRCRQPLLALLAGASVTLAMAPFHAWPLTFLAPTLLLLLLINTAPWQAALTGWLFGLGVFASGASWVYVSIHVHGNTPVTLALIMTSSFVAGLGLFFALHAWIWRRFLADRWWLISWPLLWILMEAFRSWFLTGFPWLLLGTAHLSSPLSGWAPVIGVYGISGLSALIGLLLVWALKPHWFTSDQRLLTSQNSYWRLSSLLAGLALLASGWLLQPIAWTQPLDQDPTKVALIQGNIPQEDKWNPNHRANIIQTYLDLSAQAGEVDLLLWPETALPLTPRGAQPYMEEAVQQAGDQAALITGLASPAPEANRFYNSLVTAGAAQGDYHKVQLVPFGEYLPLEGQLRGVIDFFDLPMSSFIPGPEHPGYLQAKGTRIAPLICYEVAYPDFTARQAQDSHWLLTVSNDSWFGRSIGPLQHYQIARFRALETGREMARATNNGITAVIDHQGQVKAELEQFTSGLLVSEIQPRSGNTPFMYWGSWPLLLLSLTWIAWRTLPRQRQV